MLCVPLEHHLEHWETKTELLLCFHSGVKGDIEPTSGPIVCVVFVFIDILRNNKVNVKIPPTEATLTEAFNELLCNSL